jgi:hypothetical protein
VTARRRLHLHRRPVALVKFDLTFGQMVKSGLPFPRAIRRAGTGSSERARQAAVRGISSAVVGGLSRAISESCSARGGPPGRVAAMRVAVGVDPPKARLALRGTPRRGRRAAPGRPVAVTESPSIRVISARCFRDHLSLRGTPRRG